MFKCRRCDHVLTITVQHDPVKSATTGWQETTKNRQLNRLKRGQAVEPLTDRAVSTCSMSLSESAMFFYPWYPAFMLAFEAGTVIDMRLWKIARGGAEGAAESRLMVSEKLDALLEAGALLAGGSGSDAVIDMYRKHVAANTKRLHA